MPSAPQYVECDPSSVVADLEPDAFFNKSYDERLLAMLSNLVAHEGPVLDVVMARRVSRAQGWQRTGSRIQERVEDLARRVFKTTEEDVGTFYWPTELSPGSEVPFRSAGPDAQRSVDEVCMEELIALARAVADPTVKDEDNLLAMARQLGLTRPRIASLGRMHVALKRYMQSQADSLPSA